MSFLQKPRKTTIYNSGPPQDSSRTSRQETCPQRRSSGAWAATSPSSSCPSPHTNVMPGYDRASPRPSVASLIRQMFPAAAPTWAVFSLKHSVLSAPISLAPPHRRLPTPRPQSQRPPRKTRHPRSPHLPHRLRRLADRIFARQ